MSKVIPLFPSCVSPDNVLENVSQRREDIKEICVIVKTKEGKFVTWASGDLSYLSDAALLLNHLATSCVRDLQEGFEE